VIEQTRGRKPILGTASKAVRLQNRSAGKGESIEWPHGAFDPLPLHSRRALASWDERYRSRLSVLPAFSGYTRRGLATGASRSSRGRTSAGLYQEPIDLTLQDSERAARTAAWFGGLRLPRPRAVSRCRFKSPRCLPSVPGSRRQRTEPRVNRTDSSELLRTALMQRILPKQGWTRPARRAPSFACVCARRPQAVDLRGAPGLYCPESAPEETAPDVQGDVGC